MPKVANNEGRVEEWSEIMWDLIQQTPEGKKWRIVADEPPAEVRKELSNRAARRKASQPEENEEQ